MGFLFRSNRLSKLVTCLLQREGPNWSAMWVSDGRAPTDFVEGSLSAAVDKASAGVASLYAGKPEATPAELQFAIYPWQGGADKVMLDLTRAGAGLTARDIQGSGITFHSSSIDEVVTDAERYLANPNEAMLRWIRPIAEL